MTDLDRTTQATHEWVAQQLGLSSAGLISSVAFDSSYGYAGCDTCGYGGKEAGTYVSVTLTNGQERRLDVDEIDFGTMIREISALVRL